MANESAPFSAPSGTAENPNGNPGASAQPNTPTEGVPERADGAGRGELMDRVARTAHDTIDRLADSAAPHVNRLADRLNEAGHRMKDSTGPLLDASGAWTENLRSTVRDNPLAAVAAALVLGMVVARLTH